MRTKFTITLVVECEDESDAGDVVTEAIAAIFAQGKQVDPAFPVVVDHVLVHQEDATP